MTLPVSRRMVVAGIAAGVATRVTGAGRAARGGLMSGFAYIGCRTSRERNAKGDGISVWRIAADGAWSRVQLVRDLVNPSWLAFDRTRRFLYTVHGDGSEASAFRIDPATGELAFLNRVTTGGRNPVHLMADPTNRFMVVANHIVAGEVKSGLATLPIAADGRLGAPVDVVALDGKIGPHRVEQPFPKPHQVQFDPSGKFIVVPDKGCDRVLVYTIDGGGKLHLVEAAGAAARETSGPRHVAFHPGNRFAYVINELDSTVVAYRFDPASGALRPFQVASALAEDFTGNSRGSEIAVSRDGRYLYASNRGADTLATFAIDRATGRLTLTGASPAGGKTPRFFTLTAEGATMFVANEEGHTIVRHALDPRTGLPQKPVVVAETGSPTSILLSG
ncbi:MAG: hemagglutinin [Sphingomonas bacterium]|uniref:lactonase family protein n=1 Tax=Sphingomonas bacterium TaxID=1895847 RepID=UPI00261F4AC8|nr:lactonase family protein [Sphingomonas bacterium]MDB5708396.1 hemagglutinin [Sphingomonas bacterium]